MEATKLMARKHQPISETYCSSADACASRTPLEERPLLSFVEAVKVMALFKVLSNDTRIRLLHHIVRSGEATVTDMARTLGMKPQAVSNQLVRLSDTGMLASRREGNNVYYRVMNACVAPLLDLALCLMEDERSPRNPDGERYVQIN
jgi:DNA-binding transcriptional ArsR family regulator